MSKLVETMSSSGYSQNFLDEWSAVHFFVGFKLAQAFGFLPSVGLHVLYEFVLDPWLHQGGGARSKQNDLNRTGDLVVGVISAALGARYLK